MTGLLAGAAIIPDSIAGLAQGVIKTMLLQSIKLSGIVVLMAAGVLGTVVVAQQGKNGGVGGGAQPAKNPAAKAAVTARATHRAVTNRAAEQVEEIRTRGKKGS